MFNLIVKVFRGRKRFPISNFVCLNNILGSITYRLSTKPAFIMSASNPFVIKPTAQHKATFIFMHGLGDTGKGWKEEFSRIKSPHIKYIFPNAPSRPITLNGGMVMPGWYDIQSIDMTSGRTQDDVGIHQSCQSVSSIIDEEIHANPNIKHDNMIIGGFSQGGAIALYHALTCGHKLGAVVALSTYIPLHDRFPGASTEHCKGLKIFQGHGESDPLIHPHFGHASNQLLKQMCGSESVHYHAYPDLQHSSSQKEMHDVKAFVNAVVSGMK